MLRLAAFAVTSALATTALGPLPPLPTLPVGRLLGAGPDRLTITVSGTGNRRADGEYRLECNPVGGNHPEAQQACARLDEFAKAGKDPFVPDPKRQLCTMQDGGPATARVTGTWQGHKVDTTFRRKNGCEISRWKDLEPVLPPARG
ncbi:MULTISPECIES: SSI family serine proteinase inhibitor [unclassified Streptomyces]|uniref:SSI family serine proteinase inhibitor n=1 Tax=unclassified Streptomyces TaxID=2593676 RepID=UPI00224EBB06|nr:MULTISPECIES: SSI family serine proteinase inhibitor [unclassified Streptomyces]MCX4526726.1 subtilase-type protease inhibitor [Streptomyces sp. NBC_01551]MCX4542712.1 subtilase-type protease inhibitor [Streptomyces sp. NBC_01565]